MIKNDVPIECQIHQKACLVIDVSNQGDSNKRYFCAKCLISDNIPKCPLLLEEANNEFLEFLKGFKEKVQAQNTQNLQIFDKLKANIQSLQTHVLSNLDKINEKIKQCIKIQQDKTKQCLDKLQEIDIHSYLKSPQDFSFQVANIDQNIFQTEFDKLNDQGLIENCLLLIKNIDSSQFSLEFESYLYNNDQKKKHKKEIDLNLERANKKQIQQTNNATIQKFKVVFIGDTMVGKSSIINQFIYCQFSESIQSTVGMDFTSRTIKVNPINVRLQFWDTAGQVRYRSLIPSYIRDSKAAVLCYDVTNAQSFENIQYWLQEVREERGTDFLGVLIANKTDLEEQRVITTENGKNFAQDHNLLFYEVSAKNKSNIGEFFHHIAEILIDD